MTIKSINPYYHIAYWCGIIVTLTLVFGASWGSNQGAFYFVSLLLPIVIGTSYFFNFFLVPRFLLKKRYVQFALYTFYTVIVSLYLEILVVFFSYVYLLNFDIRGFGPNASDTLLLAIIIYLLVSLGVVLLLIQQIKENKEKIQRLIKEKEKADSASIEVISNRKSVRLSCETILYIESLDTYICIHSESGDIESKEKISSIENRLPEAFVRIHRSFIVNKEKVSSFSNSKIQIGELSLNIGRSYQKQVKNALKRRSLSY